MIEYYASSDFKKIQENAKYEAGGEVISISDVMEDSCLSEKDIYKSWTLGAFPNPITSYTVGRRGKTLGEVNNPSWVKWEYLVWKRLVEMIGEAHYGKKWMRETTFDSLVFEIGLYHSVVIFRGKLLIVFEEARSMRGTGVTNLDLD